MSSANSSGELVSPAGLRDKSTAVAVIVSDEARLIVQWVCSAIICQLVDVFGTIGNIINIICFVKQGLKDPVNVSFLGLAISDLGCLVTLIWTNICFTPAFQEAMTSFDAVEIQYLTAGWPHVMFTRVTSWITAVITVERCLCVTWPLKVKTFITSRRITFIIVLIFITLIISNSPVYYANRFGMKFSPERNNTIFGLVYTNDRAKVEGITFALNNVLIPFGAFVTVIISTLILVIKLRTKAKWRKRCTVAGSVDTASERDQRVTKMAVMISILFIACFIPQCFTFIANLVTPTMAIGGKDENAVLVLGGLGFLLESINSAMNIFIYYHMSSRYRAAFKQLFRFQCNA